MTAVKPLFSKGRLISKTTGYAMKLTTVLMALALMQASARGLSQVVTFSGKNVPLQTVFAEIKKQTGVSFFYNAADLSRSKPVTVNLKNEPVKAALEEVLQDQPLTFLIKGRTVFIKSKAGAATEVRFASYAAMPPSVDVHGKVTSVSGEPVAGATITVKGTKKGTASNANGEFELRDVAEDAVLVFGSIGYETVEVVVKGRTQINVQLKVAVKGMDEMVVIAYGTQKKKEVTGSVTSITGKQLQDIAPTVTVEQALQGRAAGVYVVQETGQPGSATRVRIRGSSSLLGSNQPLYVVDGVPVVADGNIPDDASAFNTSLMQQGLSSPLNNIDPSDIESITILKDASATAIYGSRAANGVVIITTKKGTAHGKPAYMLSSSVSVQEAQTEKMLNAQQFREIWTEAANNSASTAAIINEIKDGSYFGNANTNWEKEVSRATPITRNINFSIAGGNDKARYYTALSHQDQNGVFENSFFRRYSFLVNLDLSVSRHLNLGSSVNLSSSEQGSPDGGLLSRIYSFRPDLPVYDADGNYTFSNYYNLENPVALSKATNTNNTALLLGSVYGEAKIANNFRLRSTLSLNLNKGKLKSYYPRYTLTGGFSRTGGLGNGYAQESSSEFFSHLWENTLTYNKVFAAKHAVNGVLGASWQGDNSEYLKASGEGFPQDEILNNLSSATSDFDISSNKTQSGLISYFGRVNYTYNDKYMLSVSARTDGSSKFASENKWAFFPTVAGAWRISKERFLDNVDFLDELKLRGSIGLTGVQNFSAYQWRTLFESSNYGGQPAVIQNQLGNSRLKWELTRQSDVGLDFSLFGHRFNGTFDYYVKNTSDLLYFVKVPGNTGFASVIGNLGSTRNKGVELSLDGDIVRGKDFSWNLAVNVAHNSNKLVKLNDDYLDNAKGVITPPNTGSVLRVGDPLGLIYGYVADGIFQNQEEVNKVNAASPTGVYQVAATAPGDIRFKDISGPNGVPDGRITSEDQTVIGNAQPDFVGGFTNTFEYKGLRLSALFTYSVGNDLRWGTQATAINIGTTFNGENKMAMILNRWTPQNPASQPRVVYNDPNTNGRISSFYVHDASYLRLKNLHLSYTLPEKLLARTRFIKSAQVYAIGANLLTFTKYPGANPETSNLYNDDVSTGLDNSRFPISKVYTAGIRFGF